MARIEIKGKRIEEILIKLKVATRTEIINEYNRKYSNNISKEKLGESTLHYKLKILQKENKVKKIINEEGKTAYRWIIPTDTEKKDREKKLKAFRELANGIIGIINNPSTKEIKTKIEERFKEMCRNANLQLIGRDFAKILIENINKTKHKQKIFFIESLFNLLTRAHLDNEKELIQYVKENVNIEEIAFNQNEDPLVRSYSFGLLRVIPEKAYIQKIKIIIKEEDDQSYELIKERFVMLIYTLYNKFFEETVQEIKKLTQEKNKQTVRRAQEVYLEVLQRQ